MPIDKVVNGKEVTFYAYDELTAAAGGWGCHACPVNTGADMNCTFSRECRGGFLRPRRQPAGDPVEVQTFGPLVRKATLPTDSAARKDIPLHSGVLAYFPAALMGVARISKLGNDKHNPGQPLHHARGKSMDHADCVMRHLMDLSDLIAANARAPGDSPVQVEAILSEASNLAWRALAYSQQLHERYGAAPLAPGAKE